MSIALEWIIIALLILVALLLLAILLILFKSPSTTETLTQRDVVNALSASLEDKKISETIGRFKEVSEEMSDEVKTFNNIVAMKEKRAKWGEWHLEDLLKESFPKVKIRKQIKGIGTPDAHIKTSEGVLIIDSKFVYDNYSEFLKIPKSQKKTREKKLTAFRDDIKRHVKEIKTKYIKPGDGTLEVAYMFIPSEGVYHFLIEKEFETVRWAAEEGVMICSPMNLIAHMYMIRIADIAQRMDGSHEEMIKSIQRVQKSYEDFRNEYDKLHGHIANANNKNNEVLGKINSMKSYIDSLQK